MSIIVEIPVISRRFASHLTLQGKLIRVSEYPRFVKHDLSAFTAMSNSITFCNACNWIVRWTKKKISAQKQGEKNNSPREYLFLFLNKKKASIFHQSYYMVSWIWQFRTSRIIEPGAFYESRLVPLFLRPHDDCWGQKRVSTARSFQPEHFAPLYSPTVMNINNPLSEHLEKNHKKITPGTWENNLSSFLGCFWSWVKYFSELFVISLAMVLHFNMADGGWV